MYAEFHQFDDYRSLLKAELDCRRARNPAYSLRAFARDIKTSASTLCEVLKGQQSLSRSKAQAVAKALDLDDLDQEFFCDLVESQDARSDAQRKSAKQRVKKHKAVGSVSRMRREVFRMISDWHHAAILELLTLPDFVPNPDLIGARLGVPAQTISEALRRMIELGILKMDGDRLIPHYGDFKVGGDVPSSAIRNFHQQTLEKATKALTEQNVKQREYASVIMAIDSSEMARAKNRIQAFVEEFSKEFSRPKDKDRLYALTLQFFAVDKSQANDTEH